MKYCVKCKSPIYAPSLAESETEICACCDEISDPIESIRQEAFVEGWEVSRREFAKTLLQHDLFKQIKQITSLTPELR